ncbi:hypothetical protein BGZ60DRAFT_157662 [Tricladium varicosporioides]|nr:hypothetical protein BGZ60DRAFT_157662 [Hymenoscyphus varicosporioides]
MRRLPVTILVLVLVLVPLSKLRGWHGCINPSTHQPINPSTHQPISVFKDTNRETRCYAIPGDLETGSTNSGLNRFSRGLQGVSKWSPNGSPSRLLVVS